MKVAQRPIDFIGVGTLEQKHLHGTMAGRSNGVVHIGGRMRRGHWNWVRALLGILVWVTWHRCAPACAALQAREQQPQTIIAGFNIYAPDILGTGGPASTTLLFGGWLDKAQIPHDAIYRCRLATTPSGWGPCGQAKRIARVDDIAASAQHVNDPAAECDVGGECRYAATLCLGACGAWQQLNQIWIGRAPSDAQLFSHVVPLLVDGAAEPALGSLPGVASPVVYFTRRRAGDLATIFAQPVDWQWLTPAGEPVPVLTDRRDYVVSSVDYLHANGCHILIWNRLLPLRDRGARPGELRGMVLGYSLAADSGQWAAPRPLPLPAGAPCMALTPALAIDPHGQIALFIGAIAAGADGGCVITNWSKQILQYRLQLQ